MDETPDEGFEKIRFLLTLNPPPYPAFGNLLILYCQYDYQDIAADLLADNPTFISKYLSEVLIDFPFCFIVFRCIGTL